MSKEMDIPYTSFNKVEFIEKLREDYYNISEANKPLYSGVCNMCVKILTDVETYGYEKLSRFLDNDKLFDIIFNNLENDNINDIRIIEDNLELLLEIIKYNK